ncbi:sensor histidine kinase [Inquilinus limosus]|uniref:sensor histidine kinase n=1 Tax=Inquilinus limosus TaxID=171674 RepID=UPI00041F3313|nr:sensor histidine kinase [Inquilinus limosus]
MPLSPEAAEASSVIELRRLYRDAEARAARLRFIVDVHAGLEPGRFEEAAGAVLARIAAFAGAGSAVLEIEASHGLPAWRSAVGQTDRGSGGTVDLCSRDGGATVRLALRLLPGRHGLAAEDRDALDVALRGVATAVGLQRQAAERQRLLDDLAGKRAELAALVRRLIEAQEQERRRVAHDLHDGSAQTLAALGYRLQTVTAGLPEDAALRQELEEIADLARRSVAEIRAAIADLRPPELDGLGLTAALRARLDMLNGVDVSAELSPAADRWPAAVGLVLYRVAQEALANVVKHAGAGRVTVRLLEDDGHAHLHVIDDGKGISAAGVPGAAGERLGIAGMRERLAVLGGRLELEGAAGQGTAVRAAVPLPAGAEAR